ncbi:GRANULINS domain-containing protein [Caerostris darwini]|uniref:GRANULINS domain-containing protein n=1 Tax=Caerostris darwini TaxID=1538125 RepID=A0AAV4QWN3_9ARAC|nr:GRANULINS domain-containing protein [Caerostris darwini]
MRWPTEDNLKMQLQGFFTALFVLLSLSSFTLVLTTEENEAVCTSQCGNGCCPHAEGVCCGDGRSCCKHDQTCLPHLDTCIGLKSTQYGNVTLYSEKATPIGGVFCPEGTTSCEGGCCPYENAVCCNDGYCCPEGFQCTPTSCMKDGIQNVSLKKSMATRDPENNLMGLKLKDLGIQVCPDKLHLCPGNADCCERNGKWGCCPKVTNLRGECCSQLGIWWCCTDLVPKCHWWGCWWT